MITRVLFVPTIFFRNKIELLNKIKTKFIPSFFNERNYWKNEMVLLIYFIASS